jgi:hypothetical protein
MSSDRVQLFKLYYSDHRNTNFMPTPRPEKTLEEVMDLRLSENITLID